MDKRVFVIAGPPASGKSTAFNFLKTKLGQVTFLPEINPFVLTGGQHRGGAFVDEQLQLKIAETDLKIAEGLTSQSGLFVIETGVFGLVYLENLLGEVKAEEYFKKYLAVYKKLNPYIIYIDVVPEVSWQRRSPSYEKRAKKLSKSEQEEQEMMEKYKKHVFGYHSLWSKFYEKLPFGKIKIDNSQKSEQEFLEAILSDVTSKLDR